MRVAKRTQAARKRNVATPNTDAQRASGDWNPLWDTLREWDAEFLEGYFAFRNVPHRNGPLPPKYKELILIAINASTTHLYAPGVRRHIRNALQLGATPEEIMEAVQLTTILGIHAYNLALPVLAEELKNAGRKAPAARRAKRRRAR
ncbi:MAG TPA: carboxymuconolactone decarboxylase family protein [Burkholderiales bacterium]|nr:carboxymuconolactone decarboxylase family protein [Burkholderiales bacterium]